MNRRRMAAAIALGICFCAASALAEPVPPEAIQAQHQSCVASCAKAGAPAARCEKACGCADDEVRSNFTMEQYVAMSKAVRDNPQQPDFPADIKPKVEHLLQTCYRQ